MYYLDEDKAGVWQDIKTSWAVVVVPLAERSVLTQVGVFLYYIGTSAQMLTKRRGKFVLIFFKKMDQTRPIFVYFCYFHMTNIVQIQ